MATLFADRGFISVNGVEVLDIENVTLKISDGTKPVPTMSRNRRHKGFVKGNRDITLSFTAAVRTDAASPKLEAIDYNKNDVAATLEVGADRYTVKGLDLVDSDVAAAGVGGEVKKTFNMVGLDVIDQVGNSDLFPSSL